MTKTEFSSKSPSYSFIVINKPCKAQFLLRVLACYNIRMCSLSTDCIFVFRVLPEQCSFACRLAALLITATLSVGMLGLNLTWGVNTCLRFLCVMLCRKRPYDGPIPHPRTPTRCLPTRFRNPCNQQEAPGHFSLHHRICTDTV